MLFSMLFLTTLSKTCVIVCSNDCSSSDEKYFRIGLFFNYVNSAFQRLPERYMEASKNLEFFCENNNKTDI